MPSAFDLNRRKVIVTGAAGDIGRAAARALAIQGAQLVLTDLSHNPSGTIPEGAEWRACDVTNRQAVHDLTEAHPDAQVLVLSAGILPFDDWTDPGWDASFDRVMDVNVKGILNLARAYLPVMERQRAGRIVVVGSASGRMGGVVAGPHYAASKGAAHALVRWLAIRAAPHGVTVNGVAPGSVRSDMLREQPFNQDKVPLGRMAEADEIGWPIAFLCSDAASYMCGAVLDVNGGLVFS